MCDPEFDMLDEALDYFIYEDVTKEKKHSDDLDVDFDDEDD